MPTTFPIRIFCHLSDAVVRGAGDAKTGAGGGHNGLLAFCLMERRIADRGGKSVIPRQFRGIPHPREVQ